MGMACNLIIDSCCDLPYDLVDREGVYLLKFPYSDNSGEHLDDLYRSQSAHDFYESMRQGNEPRTAQVPIPFINEAFEWALAKGKPTVFLAFTSGLSGTFDTITLLSEQFHADHPDFELHIIDTKLASVAEGLVVYQALKLQEQGMSAADLASWAKEARYFINEQFMVEDLETLHRGGRVPASVAVVGTKLDVKPLLDIDLDGKLRVTGMARGRKKGIRALAEHCLKHRDPSAYGGEVVIAGSDCPEDAKRLETLLTKEQSMPILHYSIGPVIGSHVGPGMLAVVFWGEDSRNEEVSMAGRLVSKVRGK